jgi:hypothetical protein
MIKSLRLRNIIGCCYIRGAAVRPCFIGSFIGWLDLYKTQIKRENNTDAHRGGGEGRRRGTPYIPPQKNSINLVIKHQNRGLGFSHNPKHPLQKNLKITEHLAIQIFKLKR